MKIKADNKVVPMVMFHSIGLQNYPWLWSHLSEPLDLFEEKVKVLVKNGFRTVFWNELYDHMAGRKILKGRNIVLTFDDQTGNPIDGLLDFLIAGPGEDVACAFHPFVQITVRGQAIFRVLGSRHGSFKICHTKRFSLRSTNIKVSGAQI